MKLLFSLLLLAPVALAQFVVSVPITSAACSAAPSGYTALCIDVDGSLKISKNGATPTFPDGIDTTKLSLSGGTMTGIINFAPGQTVPLPKPLNGNGAGIVTGPSSASNGILAAFTGTTGQIGPSTLQMATVVTTVNSNLLPESRITNLTTDLAAINTALATKQPTLPAKGTVVTDTTPINGNSCSGPFTLTMPGVTTSSNFNFTPAVDTSTFVGWGAIGGLRFTYWPSANALNYYVCNVTPSAITPGGPVTWNVGVF